MDIRKQVGWNLRVLRLKRGLSQEAVAGTAVNPAHVSRIERGVENPTVMVLAALAKALGVEPREFFKPVKPGSPLPEPLKKGRKLGSPFRRG
jgi:transcriptional regulator with XRE-family HTH domain